MQLASCAKEGVLVAGWSENMPLALTGRVGCHQTFAALDYCALGRLRQ